MRFLTTGILLVFTTIGVIILSSHQPFNTAVPALGNILSPFSGFWQNAEKSALPRQSKISHPALSAQGTIMYDDRLVPHIFAKNLEDAIFMQGYATAQYRLWQMDISVRATGGFLSEVLGAKTLQHDIKQRRKGMLYAAEQVVKRWEQTGEIELINKYCAGVNAWIHQLSPKDYPLEYKLMGYQPSLWTPLKSAIFLKGMTETLASSNTDLRASNALKAFEPELFEFLYPHFNPKSSPVIPKGTKWDFIRPQTDSLQNQDLSQVVPDPLPLLELWPPTPEIVGSNNWAVAGDKTASGQPILCSDPHLPLSLPSIWYEIQISTPELNAYGASLPGIPGIAIGFNEDIAWGETNGGIDVLDWYSIEWLDAEKTKYMLDGATKSIRIREESIPIKGQEAHIESVKYTYWGPIVHEEAGTPYADLAMHWIALETPTDTKKSAITTFLELMKAKNHADYLQALSYYDSPIQNFAFACKNGDIAITVDGKIPLRKLNQGRFIQSGNTSKNAWHGYIPMTEVPHVLNPPRGYISSANQRSTAVDYPYPLLGRFGDYRCRIINNMLGEMQHITPQDMMKMQNNTYSLKAAEALPILLSAQDQDSTSSIFLDLKSWDLHYDKDAKAAIIFEEWLNKTYQLTFDEVYALRDSMSILFPDMWRLIDLLKNNPTHSIFDNKSTPLVENAKAIIQSAYQITKEKYEAKYNDPAFNWAAYKGTHINHLGRIRPFSVSDIKIGGHRNSINAVQDDFGPSWRMVVELGQFPKAWGVYPGGQSGNPGSKYYDNMIGQWTNGEYNQLFFMQSKVDDSGNIIFRQEFGN